MEDAEILGKPCGFQLCSGKGVHEDTLQWTVHQRSANCCPGSNLAFPPHVLYIEFYWHKSLPIHVCITYAGFHIIKSLGIYSMTPKKLKCLLPSPLEKKFANS
jgi:hypothetical protein